MELNLRGYNALIAGSTQGIGWEAAKRLASMGATCTLLARNEDKLKHCVAQLPSNVGQQHSYLVVDFTNTAQLKTTIHEAVDKGALWHILVNNSGGPTAGPVVDATDEQFLAAFQQHLIANHLLTTALIPGMKAAGYGRVINVISTSVKIPLKNLGVSNTIRGAVASWAKTMSNELAAFGITVNNVLPGATETERLKSIIKNNAIKSGRDEAAVEAEMLQEIPAKRFGRPDEIANLIGFLATPEAAYITGTSTAVDGGRTGTIL